MVPFHDTSRVLSKVIAYLLSSALEMMRIIVGKIPSSILLLLSFSHPIYFPFANSESVLALTKRFDVPGRTGKVGFAGETNAMPSIETRIIKKPFLRE